MTAVKTVLSLSQIKPDGVYRVKQVADLFGYDVTTVSKWIRSGKLAALGLPGQHRILGAEILRLTGPIPTPAVEPKAKRSKREKNALADIKTVKS